MVNFFRYSTEIWSITIAEEDGSLTALRFGAPEIIGTEAETPLLQEASRQLHAYLSGVLTTFALPLSPHGTPFQQKVWDALLEIPYGATISYGELAKRIGNPKACRAVGMANNRNPIAIVIPCHRVIGANGSLTGYGSGLELKCQLLLLEQGNQGGKENVKNRMSFISF